MAIETVGQKDDELASCGAGGAGGVGSGACACGSHPGGLPWTDELKRIAGTAMAANLYGDEREAEDNLLMVARRIPPECDTQLALKLRLWSLQPQAGSALELKGLLSALSKDAGGF